MSQHLYESLVQYRDWTDRIEVRSNLAVIVSMMDRGIALDQPEMLLVQAVLEDWLAQLGEGEYDELLEQAYYKLYGAWPLGQPYFVRRGDLPPMW